MNYFRGNILFASENAVNLKTQGRKDDLESLFYIVFFVLNDLKLPWIENIENKLTSTVTDIFTYLHNRRLRKFQKYDSII